MQTNRANKRHKTTHLLKYLVGGNDMLSLPTNIVICPLFRAHQLDTDRLVEIDIFGRSEQFLWPTN